MEQGVEGTRRERMYIVDGYKHGDDAKFRGYVR